MLELKKKMKPTMGIMEVKLWNYEILPEVSERNLYTGCCIHVMKIGMRSQAFEDNIVMS